MLLTVACDREDVRVEVYDGSPDLPVVVGAESMMEHGAGLRLVAALASSWGTAPRGRGNGSGSH